jgi:transposase
MSKLNGKMKMKGIRYTDKFKSEAVKQITERGYDVADVAKRLGVSVKSLYKWRRESEQKSNPAGSDHSNLEARSN